MTQRTEDLRNTKKLLVKEAPKSNREEIFETNVSVCMVMYRPNRQSASRVIARELPSMEWVNQNGWTLRLHNRQVLANGA